MEKNCNILDKINRYCSWQWLLAAMVVLLFVCSQTIVQDNLVNIFTPLFTFEYGWQTVVIFALLLVFSVIVLTKRWRKYIYESKSISILVCLIGILLFFRIEKSSLFAVIYGSITYVDIILLVAISYLVESIVNYIAPYGFEKQSEKSLSDEPIYTKEEDELNRKVFSPTIAEKIVSMKSDRCARSFGVVAPWGAGKTSFINLLKDEYRTSSYRNVEVIEFYPWHLPNKTSIAESFFRELTSRLRTFDEELYDLLKRYTEALVGNNRFDVLSKLISNGNKSSFEDVCKALKVCTKRFVVIIDDIDRLEGREILEVFKLIRGSANFPNIIFVVVYDKNYVVSALQEVSKAMNGDYIKKFFNDEYYLPDYPKEVLSDLAIKYTNGFLNDKDKVLFKEYISEQNLFAYDATPIHSFISNLRELKHWINVIRTEYEFMKGEVVLVDVANIALLRIYYPHVYNAFRVEKDTYLTIEYNRYHLYESDKDEKTSKSTYDIIESMKNLGKKDLYESKILGVKDEENNLDKRLQNLLSKLFPKTYHYIASKAACDVFCFHRYFYNTLLSSDMSDNEFESLRALDINRMKQFVDENIEEKGRALNRHLEVYKQKSNAEAENILGMIFYATSKYKNYTLSTDDLFNIIKGMSLSDTDKKAMLRQFITENCASHFVKYLAYSLDSGYSRVDWHEYISEDEKSEYLNMMLEKAVEENKTREEIFEFFRYTKRKKEGKSGNKNEDYEDDPEALNILKKACMSRPVEFLTFSIYPNNSIEESTTLWSLSDLLEKMWGSWDAFEEYLTGIDSSSPIIAEVQKFFQEYKVGNYKPIKFGFKAITTIITQ